MNINTIKLMEFDKIKEKLMEYAVSELGKKLVGEIQPAVDSRVIEGWLKETTEACAIIERSSRIPLNKLNGIDKLMQKLGKGMVLSPEELMVIESLLEDVKRIKRFMKDKEVVAPRVSSYAFSLNELEELSDEITRCIIDYQIDDKASTELAKMRKKIVVTEERIKDKLESILKSAAYRHCIQENLISMRNGRFVIPVRKEYRASLNGNVLDSSASGSTVFIEPAEVKKLQDELNLLKIEEEKEEQRILSFLTGLVEFNQQDISINIETMAHYDFLFAKAKYSKAIGGNTVSLNNANRIMIKRAKHPLIGASAIPLDFRIGADYRSLVITGPNTGGKTVALKTVGLLTMMVQAGMHVPVAPESEFAVFTDILADIGDGQSIEQSLSTFSSHIKNIISIIDCADPNALIILDELGAGTDPTEGVGLAVAVLEKIHAKGATTLATTHYSEIKEFASAYEGFENGCMEFDIETLKPLYRLKIGQAGESNAFYIALKLGMDNSIIERAHEFSYKEKRSYAVPEFGTQQQRLESPEIIAAHNEKVEKVQKIQDARKKAERQQRESVFKIGDAVYISSLGRTGIVCELENGKGEVGVMVMKKRLKINKKRLSLHIDGKELYPENYDFDIVFESVETRKKKHLLNRKHVDGLMVKVERKE